MYQDFVLSLAWWWLVVAETWRQVFNSADLINVVLLTVINIYIITDYAVIDLWSDDVATKYGRLNRQTDSHCEHLLSETVDHNFRSSDGFHFFYLEIKGEN
jgi:hypothetical protein